MEFSTADYRPKNRFYSYRVLEKVLVQGGGRDGWMDGSSLVI